VPAGIQGVIRSRTPGALVLGRTFVNGPDDVTAVHKLQQQYRVVPLSLWGRQDAALPKDRDVLKPFDSTNDPLAVWKTINAAMDENPPSPRYAQLVKLFATVGIGAGQVLDGAKNYTLTFDKGGLPPVKEFWSITMYGPDHNLVENPINRFAIRARAPGIRKNEDGSITLYLQAESPGPDKESFRYRRPGTGKENFLGLGPYPDITLVDARWSATTARNLVRESTDPVEHRRAESTARKRAAEGAFHLVARRLSAHYSTATVSTAAIANGRCDVDEYYFRVFSVSLTSRLR
jgi:hypothetical protein